VTETANEPVNPKTYPAELELVLRRANLGDVSALPELRKAYDEHPELVGMFGDLVQQAEAALLELASPTCLASREAIARQLAGLRRRLQATATSELEKLLIDRICLSWVEVHHAAMERAGLLLQSPGTHPATQAADRRLDRAQARYLAAVRALATVQKLVRPALSPLDLAAKTVEERAAGGAALRRSAKAPSEGVAVVN
jgi:hypothetical protein